VILEVISRVSQKRLEKPRVHGVLGSCERTLNPEHGGFSSERHYTQAAGQTQGKDSLLRPIRWTDRPGPVLAAANIRYELADRGGGIACGGIGLMHLLARHTGLVEALDANLHLLKARLPYHESDHVLNIAYNQALALVRQAGSRKVLFRGDTDFSQTTHLDRWDREGVRFVFGMDAKPNLVQIAAGLPAEQWSLASTPSRVNHQLESRMRENPPSGSEGVGPGPQPVLPAPIETSVCSVRRQEGVPALAPDPIDVAGPVRPGRPAPADRGCPARA